MSRKIISFEVSPAGIVALCNDGTLWQCNSKQLPDESWIWKWVAFPPIPQP